MSLTGNAKGDTMRILITAALASIATAAFATASVNLDAPGALEALKKDRPSHYEKVIEAMDRVQAVPYTKNGVHDLLAKPDGQHTERDIETSFPAKTRLKVPVEDTDYLITVVFVKNPATNVPVK